MNLKLGTLVDVCSHTSAIITTAVFDASLIMIRLFLLVPRALFLIKYS